MKKERIIKMDSDKMLNEEGRILKLCKGCSCILLLKFYRKNRKGNYGKSCINCLERARLVREKNKLKNKDKFKCEKCDYKTDVKSSLNRHIKSVHDGVKDILCPDCDFKCSFNGNLKQHIKSIHTKIKDFECDICDFKCNSKNYLTKHINRVHHEIRDFKCSKCDYKFKSNSHLKRHIKTVHNKIKNIKCGSCEYICSNNSHLKHHIKAVHNKIKNFVCLDCDFKTATNGSLTRHKKLCTGKITCSSGEFKIMEILEKFNINFEYNTTYKLKHKNYLRWDFIIEINKEKSFIEFDGKQHFEPVNFGGMCDEKALISFNKTTLRDKLKNEFCEDNNLKLLRIPYYEKNNIEKLIKEFLKIE